MWYAYATILSYSLIFYYNTFISILIYIFFELNLFNNDNPVFYFNPHWDMQLSSYLGWRDVVLDFFRKHTEYNLIFAPHPLVKHLSKIKNYNTENENDGSENIIIDLESTKLNDGTYNALSDVYIGDVSSMVTEWINFKPNTTISYGVSEFVKWYRKFYAQ